MSITANTRADLYRKFQSQVNRTQENLEEDLSLEYEQNMLKTYIIESNVSPDEFLSNSNFVEEGRQIDDDLFELNVTTESSPTFYIDFQYDRFWSLYTLAGSEMAKRTVKKLTTSGTNGLDRLWIPNHTQRGMLDYGDFLGAGMKQSGGDTFPEDFVNVGDLRLELDGRDSLQFYEIFKESADIEKVLSLSRIKIRRERGKDHMIERITNQGAFTARAGTNIHIHLDTVERVKDTYKEIISAIETNHRLSYKDQEGTASVEGRHIRLDLDNGIDDIEEFISRLVDAGPPFRLVGPSTKIDEGYYKVRAVDLHNGDRVTLEIEPSQIRIYLYEEACGNTALRIFTNIQHYYDPSAVLNVEGISDV